MGYGTPENLWVMGYHEFMGYGCHFPANQLGRHKNLWGFTNYGLSQLWVKTESTVDPWEYP
ncbi:hypothetical protein CPC08DRAFT_786358 [Agrocybe pediades]|nr:hypothetical protein CPC08DRAFT_786358 [Agrocybe pediades]